MPKLQYRFDNTTKDISLYDTPPNDKNVAVQLDGKTYYAGLLPAGHTRASNLRICRAGQEAYAVAKEGGEKAFLEDYSWSEIAAIIKAGNAAEYFAVGDTRPITLGSVEVDQSTMDVFVPTRSRDIAGTYRVQILGINHNAEIEGYNRVHFAIGRDENDTTDICFYGKRMSLTLSNAGGWEDSDLRSWLNDTFYNALPADLRNVITVCTKYTDNVGQSREGIEESVTATSDKIWIPALFEVFGYVSGTEASANPYEQNKQTQYDYYKNGNGVGRAWSFSHVDKSGYWLRSRNCINHPFAATHFCLVGVDAIPHAREADNFSSFVPCFTIS